MLLYMTLQTPPFLSSQIIPPEAPISPQVMLGHSDSGKDANRFITPWKGLGGPGCRPCRVEYPAEALPGDGEQRWAGGWPHVHGHLTAARLARFRYREDHGTDSCRQFA